MSRGLRAALAIGLLVFAAAARAAAPRLDVDVELDPAGRQFKAHAVVVPPARDFRFELHQGLRIEAASVDGNSIPVVPAGERGALRAWRVVLPINSTRLRLEYGGQLPALQSALDHRGVIGGLPPMMAEQGSYLPAGSGWYPQPAELFSYRVTLSVPAGQRALVPGRLVSEQLPADGAGRYLATFEFSHPADGIDLMAGPWIVRERVLPHPGGDTLRLRTYFSRELDAMPGLADGYLDDASRYLERYSARIGPYPFTEFSVVASPLPTGFGMPTLTYIGAEVLKLPFIRATSLGHEVLHNWWGNGVYVDYAQGNWCEGLTTFMADYAYKAEQSPAAAREMRLGWLRDFAAVAPDRQQTLASFRYRAHGAAASVGYGKAAMLFVMLHDLIGAEAFDRGIRTLWQRYRFETASWSDLRATFEQASGRSLEAFFEQWLRRVGGPAVKIVDAVADQEGSGARLSLTVGQSAPAYALRLPIELMYRDGSEQRWIESRALRETVVLDLDKAPTGLRLDPDLRVWRVLDAEQLPPILRQWIVARAPRLLPASSGAELNEAVDALAARLFERPVQTISVDALDDDDEPVLVAGLHDDVDAMLARLALPPRPEQHSGRGSAQVWTVQRDAGAPVAVVSARDAVALRALLRPLPHYGSQSWLVFDGSRAIERGVWPARGTIFPVRLRR